MARPRHSPSLAHAPTVPHCPSRPHTRVALPQRPQGSTRVSPARHEQSSGAEQGPQAPSLHVVVPSPHSVEQGAVEPGPMSGSRSSQSEETGAPSPSSSSAGLTHVPYEQTKSRSQAMSRHGSTDTQVPRSHSVRGGHWMAAQPVPAPPSGGGVEPSILLPQPAAATTMIEAPSAARRKSGQRNAPILPRFAGVGGPASGGPGRAPRAGTALAPPREPLHCRENRPAATASPRHLACYDDDRCTGASPSS